jgi:hypothetical protein
MRPAYDAVEAWIIDQGGQPEGPGWEIYYSDPNEEPDPSNWAHRDRSALPRPLGGLASLGGDG